MIMASDIEVNRLRLAARRAGPGPAIQLSALDAQYLPFPDGYFDSVVGTLVFCSVPDPSRALAEIRRVLRRPDPASGRTGGRIYLIDHVRSHREWIGQVQDLCAPLWLAITGGCHLNRDTESTVREAGFRLAKVKVGWAGLLKLMVGSMDC